MSRWRYAQPGAISNPTSKIKLQHTPRTALYIRRMRTSAIEYPLRSGLSATRRIHLVNALNPHGRAHTSEQCGKKPPDPRTDHRNAISCQIGTGMRQYVFSACHRRLHIAHREGLSDALLGVGGLHTVHSTFQGHRVRLQTPQLLALRRLCTTRRISAGHLHLRTASSPASLSAIKTGSYLARSGLCMHDVEILSSAGQSE